MEVDSKVHKAIANYARREGARNIRPEAAQISPVPGLKPKIDALVPPTLTEDNSPSEYNDWKRCWRAYYEAAGMSGQDIHIQRSFLDAVLNPHLATLLRSEAIDAAEIFEENGCIEKLDIIFQRFYPLFIRRAEFWNFKQKPGQKYSEALAMCRRIGDECDVTSMTGEEVMCTKMITLYTDEELKAELMKPELPTIPGPMQIVHQYEQSQAGKLALQHAQQANAAGPRGNSRNSKRTPGQLANSQNGKCKGCGGAHQRDKVPPQRLHLPRVRDQSTHQSRLPGKRGEAQGTRRHQRQKGETSTG